MTPGKLNPMLGALTPGPRSVAEGTTCVTGSASPDRVQEWASWAAKPLDQPLLNEVLAILQPIHNWFYAEGRLENNDPGAAT